MNEIQMNLIKSVLTQNSAEKFVNVWNQYAYFANAPLIYTNTEDGIGYMFENDGYSNIDVVKACVNGSYNPTDKYVTLIDNKIVSTSTPQLLFKLNKIAENIEVAESYELSNIRPYFLEMFADEFKIKGHDNLLKLHAFCETLTYKDMFQTEWNFLYLKWCEKELSKDDIFNVLYTELLKCDKGKFHFKHCTKFVFYHWGEMEETIVYYIAIDRCPRNLGKRINILTNTEAEEDLYHFSKEEIFNVLRTMLKQRDC